MTDLKTSETDQETGHSFAKAFMAIPLVALIAMLIGGTVFHVIDYKENVIQQELKKSDKAIKIIHNSVYMAGKDMFEKVDNLGFLARGVICALKNEGNITRIKEINDSYLIKLSSVFEIYNKSDVKWQGMDNETQSKLNALVIETESVLIKERERLLGGDLKKMNDLIDSKDKS